jgi:hypothetical protein
MVIEGVAAIGSGIAARSVTLLAFGIDSVIELVSAGVLIWRLTVKLLRGLSFAERRNTWQAVSAAFCCLRSLSMSSWRRGGAFGRAKGKILMAGFRRRAVAASRSGSPS